MYMRNIQCLTFLLMTRCFLNGLKLWQQMELVLRIRNYIYS